MAQSQHPKTMTVEIVKSIKNCAFFNAHFEIHKQFSVFAVFQSCKSDLPLPESDHHNTGENTANSQSKQRCVDLGAGGWTIYTYIKTYMGTHAQICNIYIWVHIYIYIVIHLPCGGYRGP